MASMTSEHLGPSRFFEWLEGTCQPSEDNLETLTGHQIEETQTPMIKRVSVAWSTPMCELTCEQVRLLVSQKMGLKWLAHPVTVFVLKNPRAFVTFYSGDLALAALRAFPELLEVSPMSARAMLAVDFTWLVDERSDDSPISSQSIKEVIKRAAVVARGHS